MERMEGIQLLPGTKKRLGIKVPGENRFLYIGSVILGAVLVSMFFLGRYESTLNKQLQSQNDQLLQLEQKRNKKDEAELKLTKDRLAITSMLIIDHAYWSQAFTWFENILQRDLQVHNFSVDSKGALNITGVTTSYTSIARQVASFLADSRVLDISVGKMIATSGGTIEFNMNLKVDTPKLIKK